jgi:nucleoside-diphosphate-sugar epimerase
VSTFLIIGAGPVGTTTAMELLQQGHQVKIATRSGTGPDDPRVERLKVDAADSKAVSVVAKNVDAILNCANPKYTRWDTDWPPIAKSLLQAAEQTGAGLVTMSNLYGYGSQHQTMDSQTPLESTGKKGLVRANMWLQAKSAHEEGRVRATEVRASDFFGPGVIDANMGERVVPLVLQDKSVQLMGKADVLHSFSYMPDVARTLCAVATSDHAWGRPWMVPSITTTQRQFVNDLSRAANVRPVKISTLPAALIRVLGLVVPLMRELGEVQYQFNSRFVIDASETTTTLNIEATSADDAFAKTIAWWRQRVSP